MKRFLALALAALISFSAQAITYTPIVTLNPAGSTAGQVIASTGPTSGPAWTSISLATLTGIVPVANGGTGVTSAAAEVTRLGAATTAATLAQFAPTTSAQLATLLTDETGTGANVFGTSPTITTPNIVGVTNATSAAAGSVGEFPTPANLSGVSLTSGTAANTASVPLTAGDWDVSCTVRATPSAGIGFTAVAAGISTTSATLPAAGTGALTIISTTFSATASQEISTPVVRVSSASASTAYCVGYAGFASGTATATGFIRARRIH